MILDMYESHRVEYKKFLTDGFEKEVVDLIENKTAALITSTTRKEQPLWSKLALREAVINAIVHNDYTTENPPVFEILSDRIVITSTEGRSTVKNQDDFFAGYSNPVSRELKRIYKDLELVEHSGSRIGRILKSHSKDSFSIKENYMKITFYSNIDPINEGINSLFKYIKTKPNKRISQIAKEINTPTKTLERWIKQLKDENKIQYIGSKKTGGYVAK